MSQEKLQAFAEVVSKNQELQKRLTAIQEESARSTAEKIAKLSESAGTPFTAEEYLQTVAESAKELVPEQLHSVTGGVSSAAILLSIFSAGLGCAVGVAASAIIEGDVGKCIK